MPRRLRVTTASVISSAVVLPQRTMSVSLSVIIYARCHQQHSGEQTRRAALLRRCDAQP